MSGEVYKLAGGDVSIWVDDSGAICLKVNNKHHDPADLSADEAIEVATKLMELAKKELGTI